MSFTLNRSSQILELRTYDGASPINTECKPYKKAGLSMIKPRHTQSGYMIEIAIIVVVVGVLLSIILPNLPPIGQKIAVVLGALVFIFGAYYMIVIPGWQPGAQRLRWPWNIVVFVPIALLIAFVAFAFVIAH